MRIITICFKTISVISLGLIITSCAFKPKPIKNEEINQRVASDNQKIYANQEPVQKRLRLSDAIARAVKYNLDYKTEVLEASSALLGYRAAFSEMFPNFNVSGNRIKRNNLNLQLSPDKQFDSTSQDKNRNVYNLDLSWNLLDLGVSYYESKVKADEYQISKEKQKQILARLTSDVRKYYWQAFAHQIISEEIDSIQGDINEAIEYSDKAVKDKIADIQQSLLYQRTLLDKYNDLLQTSTGLSEAKYKLYGLMNLPLNSNFKFIANPNFEKDILPKNFPRKLSELEQLSLYNRPELREADYKSRISLNEVYKARARMLPGIEISLTDNYDSNSFLVNNKWREISYGLTWNLIKLVANYQKSMEMRERTKLVEMQRLALAASIISQVGVSISSYQELLRQFATRKRLFQTNNTLEDVEKKKYISNLSHKLKLIEAKVYALETRAKMFLTFSNLQAAAGDLLYSIGYNPVSGININESSIEEISSKIANNLEIFHKDIIDEGISS